MVTHRKKIAFVGAAVFVTGCASPVAEEKPAAQQAPATPIATPTWSPARKAMEKGLAQDAKRAAEAEKERRKNPPPAPAATDAPPHPITDEPIGQEVWRDAFLTSQEFVTRRLKSPSSAKFPNSNHAQITAIGEGKFRVESYVDSQNSFGAMLRTNYVATLHLDPNGKTWKLDGLEMSEQ